MIRMLSHKLVTLAIYFSYHLVLNIQIVIHVVVGGLTLTNVSDARAGIAFVGYVALHVLVVDSQVLTCLLLTARHSIWICKVVTTICVTLAGGPLRSRPSTPSIFAVTIRLEQVEIS